MSRNHECEQFVSQLHPTLTSQLHTTPFFPPFSQ